VAWGGPAPLTIMMPRRIAAVLLYVLLLCMQQEGYRHGLEHLRAQLIQAHEHALQLPDTPCDECALLAGASHAVAATSAQLHVEADSLGVADAPAASPALQTRRYYSARAPPLLS